MVGVHNNVQYQNHKNKYNNITIIISFCHPFKTTSHSSPSNTRININRYFPNLVFPSRCLPFFLLFSVTSRAHHSLLLFITWPAHIHFIFFLQCKLSLILVWLYFLLLIIYYIFYICILFYYTIIFIHLLINITLYIPYYYYLSKKITSMLLFTGLYPRIAHELHLRLYDHRFPF